MYGRKHLTYGALMFKLRNHLGHEECSKEGQAYIQEAVANWKRFQPATMDGTQYRLVSPYESNHMAVNYVSQDKSQAILFAYDIHPRFQEKLMAVKLQGLNPDAMYKIEEINLMPHTASTLKANGKVLSGDYLMKVGLDVFGFAQTRSHVISITAQ